MLICEPADVEVTFPLAPMFPETFTPLIALLPNPPRSEVGIAPELKPKKRLPPHTPGPWLMTTGSPLCEVKIHDEYQPPNNLSNTPLEKLRSEEHTSEL